MRPFGRAFFFSRYTSAIAKGAPSFSVGGRFLSFGFVVDRDKSWSIKFHKWCFCFCFLFFLEQGSTSPHFLSCGHFGSRAFSESLSGGEASTNKALQNPPPMSCSFVRSFVSSFVCVFVFFWPPLVLAGR